jgi:hypothetical protein
VYSLWKQLNSVFVRTGWNALNFKSSEHLYVRFRNHVEYKQCEVRIILMIGDSCSFLGDDIVKPSILVDLPAFFEKHTGFVFTVEAGGRMGPSDILITS